MARIKDPNLDLIQARVGAHLKFAQEDMNHLTEERKKSLKELKKKAKEEEVTKQDGTEIEEEYNEKYGNILKNLKARLLKEIEDDLKSY